MTTKTYPSHMAQAARNMDDRYTMSSGVRRQINKVFPTHWSFILGENSMYSLVIHLHMCLIQK